MSHILTIVLLLNLNLSEIQNQKSSDYMNNQPKYEIATVGGGCFWCTEAVFEALKGVVSVESGYVGGFVKNPSYREVCNGTTGHAEVVQIRYDANQITYKQILDVFFTTHDPTTLNQQGADRGTQYRSVILFHNQTQKTIAEQLIKELTQLSTFNKPIVTEIAEMTAFYKAEDYHQDYFANNPQESYCTYVIRPKVEKFKKNYSEKLK
jgi:peptide-methionine (S)-S-oxide reductase